MEVSLHNFPVSLNMLPPPPRHHEEIPPQKFSENKNAHTKKKIPPHKFVFKLTTTFRPALHLAACLRVCAAKLLQESAYEPSHPSDAWSLRRRAAKIVLQRPHSDPAATRDLSAKICPDTG